MDGYPKTKYPVAGGGSITVNSSEQEKAIGPGWQDFPAFVPEPAPEEPKKPKAKSAS
jgi:hypothetical protein